MIERIAESLIDASVVADPLGFRAQFEFAPDSPVFAGHFPGRPVLPGVFEVEMVRVSLEAATGQSHRIVRVVNAKFVRAVRPGERLSLQGFYKEGAEEGRVDVTTCVGDALVASVSLIARPVGPT